MIDKRLKKDLFAELQAMEQGKFQEFCLFFLPAYNNKYNRLERHGGTIEGKTRKGTPDLLFTSNQGKQLGVQGSTEKEYWKYPVNTKKYEDWKPCKDIDRCIEELDNLEEIVLCSTDNIPTNCSNAKAIIIDYAKKKTDAVIVLFTINEIIDILCNEINAIDYHKILEKFFPDTFKELKDSQDGKKAKLNLELLLEKKLYPIEQIFKISEESVKLFNDSEEQKKYAFSKIKEISSNYKRNILPEAGNILRNIKDDLFYDNTIGKVKTLLGLPKVGKTQYLSQLAKRWQDLNMNINWYDVPLKIETIDENIFVNDLISDMLSLFFDKYSVCNLISKIKPISSLNSDNVKDNLNVNNNIFIIDNAENLSEKDLKLLNIIFKKLKELNLFDTLGIIFVSNKVLKTLCQQIDDEIALPAWTENELKKLLIVNFPENKNYQHEGYLKVLTFKCYGHPLLALSLAQKYNSINSLQNMLTLAKPGLSDERLSTEIEEIIVNHFANDKEMELFLYRMSCLVSPATEKVLHILCNKISPIISKSFLDIIKQLKNAVIEGDNSKGFYLSSLYKDYFINKRSEIEKNELYKKLSDELLIIENNIVDIEEFYNGVFYLFIRGDFKNGYDKSIFLLVIVLNNDCQEKELKYLLDKLEIFTFFLIDDSNIALSDYYNFLTLMICLCYRVKEFDKAINFSKKIDPDKLKTKNIEYKNYLCLMKNLVYIFKSTHISTDYPELILLNLLNADFSCLKKNMPDDIDMLYPQFELINAIIIKTSITPYYKILIRKLIECVTFSEEKYLSVLFSICIGIAVKAAKDTVDLAEIEKYFEYEGDLYELFLLVIKSQYYLELKESNKTLELVEIITATFQKNKSYYKSIERQINNIKGDANYQLNKYEKAKVNYKRSLELNENKQTLDYAWANYRLGLLTDEPLEAENYFFKASKTFKKLGLIDLLARSEGERAVTYAQRKEYYKFIRIAEWIVEKYFIKKRIFFGPSCSIIVAQLNRVYSELTGKPIVLNAGDGLLTPDFKRAIFDKVLAEAKPQYEGMVAFYQLGNCYSLVNNKNRKIKCLKAGLKCKKTSNFKEDFMIMYGLLIELLPAGNNNELKEIIIFLINFINKDDIFTPEKVTPAITTYFMKYISNNDKILNTKHLSLLNEIENEIVNNDFINKEWWLSEIYMRMAQIKLIIDDKTNIHELNIKAYYYALKSNNYEIIMHSGFQISFNLIKLFRGSFYDLADIQFNTLKSIDYLKYDNNYENFGMRLYQIWNLIQWKRLVGKDMDVLHILKDNSEEVKNNNFSNIVISSIMILLLSSIFNYKGNSTVWAVNNINQNQLSEKILKNIGGYFNN